MKKLAIYFLIFVLGFLAKVAVSEAYHFRDVQLLDTEWSDFDELHKIENADTTYKVLDTLNYQPEVWKFLGERCTSADDRGNGVTNAQYFKCTWQLKFPHLIEKLKTARKCGYKKNG